MDEVSRQPVLEGLEPPALFDVSGTDVALDLAVHDLERLAYAPAFELQRSLQAEVIASRDEPRRRLHLLLVEHDPPVITVSRRRTAREHLVATEAQLGAAGVEVAETDRGGDITYHGPGQLVVYPILDLNAFGLRLHGYMRLLERVVIDTLAGFGVAAGRDACATGVWVRLDDASDPNEAGDASCAQGTGGAKICAMGVRVSRWVTMHGLALNVDPDMSHFDLIVPCGLTGRAVTSLAKELGEACPPMAEVKERLVFGFTKALSEQ